MNYQRHYDNLIARARSRVLGGYAERHHVIPKCLDGSNEISNIVVLTPEEHHAAHLLLIKIYPGNVKIIYAANMMTMNTHGQRANNKRFGWFRRAFAQASSQMNTGKVASIETRLKQSAATKGKPKSPEHNEKNRLAHIGEKNVNFGKTRTEESRAKTTASLLARHFHHNADARARIGAATSTRMAKEDRTGVNNAFFGKHHTPESKAKLAASHIGLSPSIETRAKISAAGLGRKTSDKTRAKISASLKGRVFSSEWRAKLSAAKGNNICQV